MTPVVKMDQTCRKSRLDAGNITMSDPIVFGARYSTYTRSVLLALAEKGVACSLQEIDIFRGATPDYLARQPFGRIPAFEHDGFRLYETAAIMRDRKSTRLNSSH